MANVRIGKTDTGKIIYATFEEALVKDWEFLDHAQAGCAHMVARDMAIAEAQSQPEPTKSELLQIAQHHYEQAEKHQAECDRLEARDQAVWH